MEPTSPRGGGGGLWRSEGVWPCTHSPFPADSAELVAAGHVDGLLKQRHGAHADATLPDTRGNSVAVSNMHLKGTRLWNRYK